jgi:hypothetical protein
MVLDTTQLTPDQPQRERLIGGLSKLIAQRGWQRFVTGLVVEPTSSYFPDTIAPNIGGVRRLIYRLMVYAGLEELNPSLHLHDAGGPGERERGGTNPQPRLHTSHESPTDITSAAGWFAGIEDGNCLFGLDVQQTLDVDGLTGVLSHEVCHAYRNRFGLEVPTREVEEELTDLTTVFLGFGILSANASYRYRTGGTVEGGFTSSYWSVHRSGYLPPHDMCFLLAVQAVAMGLEPDELSRVKGHLDTTQRAMFSASYKLLHAERDELRADLGVPLDEEEWPEPSHPSDDKFVEPMKRFRTEPGDDQSVLVTEIAEDKSRPTFRIVGTRGALGLVLGFAAFLVLFVMGVVPREHALIAAAMGGGLGWGIGRTRKYYVCASPVCGATVAENDPTCRGCERPIAHTIKHASDRLKAEEAFEDGE